MLDNSKFDPAIAFTYVVVVGEREANDCDTEMPPVERRFRVVFAFSPT